MLWSIEQILTAKVAVPIQRCGLYFLIKEDRIVYVGQSTIVAQRAAKHRGVIHHDSYTFLPCLPHELNELEAQYIVALKPVHNVALPANSQWKTAKAVRAHFKFKSIRQVAMIARKHNVATEVLAGRVYYKMPEFPSFDLQVVSK